MMYATGEAEKWPATEKNPKSGSGRSSNYKQPEKKATGGEGGELGKNRKSLLQPDQGNSTEKKKVP